MHIFFVKIKYSSRPFSLVGIECSIEASNHMEALDKVLEISKLKANDIDEMSVTYAKEYPRIDK